VSIGRDEAAQALRDAEAAAERSVSAVGYQRSSGYLILWGVVWGVGNLAAYFSAPRANLIWFVLSLAGVVGSAVLGWRGRKLDRATGGRNAALMSLLIAAAIAGFGAGVGVVSPFHSFAQSEAVICLAVGAAYMVLGSRTGLRMSAVGFVIMVATVVGWVYARDQFFLWMAVAGGGGLILGGVWMRKA